MATETVTPIDRESAALEAAALSDLVDWISKARDLIDEIRDRASLNGSLHDAIQQHEIAINEPDWLFSEAPQGLAYLMARQHVLIKSLA
ncbi:hypothetical protein [Acidovorax sp.]|uniref:hypothetical protein n=1 Tax=Acidovorax sp. TaxID=1872122 RepID=UPI0025868E47|nr:hypothetical protein [Acidovorax sp.]